MSDIEFRWLVPKGTTAKTKKLQTRSGTSEWVDVPTVVDSSDSNYNKKKEETVKPTTKVPHGYLVFSGISDTFVSDTVFRTEKEAINHAKHIKSNTEIKAIWDDKLEVVWDSKIEGNVGRPLGLTIDGILVCLGHTLYITAGDNKGAEFRPDRFDGVFVCSGNIASSPRALSFYKPFK